MNSTAMQVQQDYDRLDEARQRKIADLARELVAEQRKAESTAHSRQAPAASLEDA